MNDPWPLLHAWLGGAWSSKDGCPEMALATASQDGVPSLRMVSLRGLDERGLRFFTHAGSRKTVELDANPHAAAMFHWQGQHRQLRVDGIVEPLPRALAESYFASRPRPAQLSAVVSRQGRVSPGLAALREEIARLAARLGDDAVPCPDDFVGYRLVPSAIELWHGATDRLHDRTVYLREADGWRVLALQP